MTNRELCRGLDNRLKTQVKADKIKCSIVGLVNVQQADSRNTAQGTRLSTTQNPGKLYPRLYTQ